MDETNTGSPAFSHTPVMPEACMEGLNLRFEGTYADGTAGGGGHSELIAERLSGQGRLICVDRDSEAIAAAKARLKRFPNVTFVKDNFCNIIEILGELGIKGLDGALLDLGVSSWQLDEPSRGFSFLKEKDAPLDMRMDRDSGLTARDVVNGYDEGALTRIFSKYGEERFAGRIARRIVASRADRPFETTLELSELVASAIPRASWEKGKHPATRVFQAIRIEVNDELSILDKAVEDFVEALLPGGRLCVITFHSLEDRLIKQAFQRLERPCQCPRDFPTCVCGKTPKIKIITRKPITAAPSETEANPRARSAKLRVAEKL